MKGFLSEFRVLLVLSLVASTQCTIWWMRGYGLAGSILGILSLQLAYAAGKIRERDNPRVGDIFLDVIDDAYQTYKAFRQPKQTKTYEAESSVSEKVLR